MKRVLILLVIATTFCFAAFTQTLTILKLDSFFNELASRDLAMGSLTIAKNGIVEYQRAIGYSFMERDKKIPADTNTKYRIGSVSKMFTAVMIFQLIEEGKITLDQKLNLYFPNLPNAKKITISNLLSHRSGLHDYTRNTNFETWMDKPATHGQLLKTVKEKGADFEPGTNAAYSNTNYLLLGYIIEKVCKMPYSKALAKRITAKIKLQTTYCGNAINSKKNESASYKFSDSMWKKEKETNMSIHGGAGSIVSTPGEMVKFIEALFAYQLVSKSSLVKMETMVDDFGMGMLPYDYGLKKGYGHNGRIEEFYSALRYFPGDKLSFAYCTNGINYPRIDILEAVLKICFNEPFTIPFSTPIILQTWELDKYLGNYSSDQKPIIVTCKKDSTQLLVEVKGKTYVVAPIGENYFMYAPNGSFFQFYPGRGELQIKEKDNVYYFKKVK